MPKAIDIVGDTYGRLKVISEILPKTHTRKYVCHCSCGNITEVWQTSLRNGLSTSCGCRRDEVATKHGGAYSRLYHIWAEMKRRCKNPLNIGWKHYGGRGIRVSEEWQTFEPFQKWALSSGYTEELTIDRHPNRDGNYEPSNCRWAAMTTQARNRNKRKDVSSDYRGVSWDAPRNKWRAGINMSGHRKNLGRYSTEIEAAKARDQYIIDNNLSDFILNF